MLAMTKFSVLRLIANNVGQATTAKLTQDSQRLVLKEPTMTKFQKLLQLIVFNVQLECRVLSSLCARKHQVFHVCQATTVLLEQFILINTLARQVLTQMILQ